MIEYVTAVIVEKVEMILKYVLVNTEGPDQTCVCADSSGYLLITYDIRPLSHFVAHKHRCSSLRTLRMCVHVTCIKMFEIKRHRLT